MSNSLTPTTFHRHNRPLRTLLLESQVWFCARDMGRLMGWPLNDRTTRKLDADQRRFVTLVDACGEENELMISESGVYTMLVHHYHAENRALRQWITNEVVPCLRDEGIAPDAISPCLSYLQWPGLSVSLLHWRSEPWIRLRDMPKVLTVDERRGHEVALESRASWWRLAVQVLRLG
ncbi:Bro-N domain-containing protein [Pseudomonas abietaniphila]|uniref:BRO-N domain-containing protein n=1 Tax=Pseudomonas abietaniphila TaxID=89065 RepID=UPI0032178070